MKEALEALNLRCDRIHFVFGGNNLGESQLERWMGGLAGKRLGTRS